MYHIQYNVAKTMWLGVTYLFSTYPQPFGTTTSSTMDEKTMWTRATRFLFNILSTFWNCILRNQERVYRFSCTRTHHARSLSMWLHPVKQCVERRSNMFPRWHFGKFSRHILSLVTKCVFHINPAGKKPLKIQVAIVTQSHTDEL